MKKERGRKEKGERERDLLEGFLFLLPHALFFPPPPPPHTQKNDVFMLFLYFNAGEKEREK